MVCGQLGSNVVLIFDRSKRTCHGARDQQFTNSFSTDLLGFFQVDWLNIGIQHAVRIRLSSSRSRWVAESVAASFNVERWACIMVE